MTEKLPWNRQDIFFDEVAEYPLYDHFPLLITTDPEQEIETSNDTQDTAFTVNACFLSHF